MVDLVGVENGHYKTYQEIPDDEKFEELISLFGNMYIQRDLEKMRDYVSQVGELGANREGIISSLNIDDIKHKYREAISTELDKIVDYKNSTVDEEYNPGGKPVKIDLNNMSDEQIDELPNQPYKSNDARGYGDLKEYENIFDVYPVHFYKALYTYMRDHMPREFYELANKLSLNLDVSPVTPSSAIYRETKDWYQDHLSRRHQQKLFHEGANEWKYSFNNKRFRLAKKA